MKNKNSFFTILLICGHGCGILLLCYFLVALIMTVFIPSINIVSPVSQHYIVKVDGLDV
jgi:hypothetical protein